MAKQPSEEIQQLLKAVYDDCSNEDRSVRERQIRTWRRLKLLWEGFSRVWYSEVAHDWRIWEETQDEGTDQAYYDKPVNVFKAYLESIIAALSVTVPPIKCFPDNADDTLDLATAKAGDKIAQLIYRHNNVPILWLHALFINVTEGMTACYCYPLESEEYGTYVEKETEEVEEEFDQTVCSVCGHVIDEQPAPISGGLSPQIPPISNGPINPMAPPEMAEPPMGQPPMENPLPMGMDMVQPTPPKYTSQQELNEFNPGPEDVELHAALNAGKDICPACMAVMDPELRREKFVTTRLVNETIQPKSRVCMEVYGGLYVKVPNYAKRQKDCPYLIFSEEKDYSLIVEEYEHLHGNKNLVDKLKQGSQSGSYNQYDQWGRLSPQYQGEYPINVITVNKAWIRPAKFNILPKEQADILKKKYPDGVKLVYANDEFAEACNESLDDCWTLSENPLAEFLHFEPLGQGLTSIQEITNDLISLVLQTIEHGIGQTFADPGVLNFQGYEQTETTPGGIFPATPKSGKTLKDAFHEMKTASLSSEVLPFSNQIQSLGQLVSGSLPSLFGGQMEGSETASQYSMSRAQALQRLQNTWKVYTTWWKTIFSKAVPLYIDNVKDDERDVQRDTDGNFVNVLITKAELEGRIGKVELEANENLPMTWAQTKDTVEKMMLHANPEVQKIIATPENIPIIHEALGLVDFYVPGEDDVIKQYDEIKTLLNSEPIPTGDEMMPFMPSVPIDIDFDNHAIEFEIVRKWVISEAGRQTKISNEAGYQNVLLHGKLHKMEMDRLMMQQAMMGQQEKGAAPGEKPKQTDQEAPIMGEGNVEAMA